MKPLDNNALAVETTWMTSQIIKCAPCSCISFPKWEFIMKNLAFSKGIIT